MEKIVRAYVEERLVAPPGYYIDHGKVVAHGVDPEPDWKPKPMKVLVKVRHHLNEETGETRISQETLPPGISEPLGEVPEANLNSSPDAIPDEPVEEPAEAPAPAKPLKK